MGTSENRSYDVIVVGAGIVGLACAWRAARRGLSVVVLERDRVGAGATGVAAGMLAPVTEADFGEEKLLRLNLDGLERWPAFAAELEAAAGVEVSLRETGALVVAADRDDAEELRRLHALQEELGLAADWLGPRELRRLEPGLSPRVAGGIHAREDAQVDPGAVVRALCEALRRDGVELREGVPVEGVDHDGERVKGVSLSGERVTASRVVVAAGAWSGRLGLPEAPAVRPVKGQLLELKVRRGPDPIERVVRTPRCYLVARGDGRVVLGATVEEQGFDDSVTAGGVFELLEAAREVLPDVDELELTAARAGLRPGSADNLPVIGPGALEGLVWATGHYRNGVLLAPLTADLVAEALTREHQEAVR